MILSFLTDSSGQTVQTQIRLLLEEQSDQGLHCVLFHLHLFGRNSLRFGLHVRDLGKLQQSFLAYENLGTLRYAIKNNKGAKMPSFTVCCTVVCCLDRLKVLNFQTLENFAVIILKFKQGFFAQNMKMEWQTVKTLIRLLL